jgi:hypothetical protein
MVAAWCRSADHAVERRTLSRDLGVDVPPIIRASAGKDPVDPLAGDLFPVDVTEACACQSELRLGKSLGQVDQADTGKKLRDAERIDVGSRRHPAKTGGSPPIIVKLTLTLRHQLSAKSPFGQHRPPPH